MILRSDRMDLSFWHYWVAPVNPVLRLLNKECRIPYIYEPKLFDFQIYTELHFQLQHFLTESRQSMDRVEAEINRFNSRSLRNSLKAATNTFKELQRQTGQGWESAGSNVADFMRHILPARFFHSIDGIQRLKEYYDISSRILQRLKDLQMSLAAFDTSIVHMKRQHNRLLTIMARLSGFDLGRKGVISVPHSVISSLANASFINFENSSLAQPENGMTRDESNFDYDLDTVLSPSDRTALRQVVVQICLEENNLSIISGFLYTICFLWQSLTSRSEFDEDLLSDVPRSWSFEQRKAALEYRKLIGHDDHSISENLVRYYRDYREGNESPAFV